MRAGLVLLPALLAELSWGLRLLESQPIAGGALTNPLSAGLAAPVQGKVSTDEGKHVEWSPPPRGILKKGKGSADASTQTAWSDDCFDHFEPVCEDDEDAVGAAKERKSKSGSWREPVVEQFHELPTTKEGWAALGVESEEEWLRATKGATKVGGKHRWAVPPPGYEGCTFTFDTPDGEPKFSFGIDAAGEPVAGKRLADAWNEFKGGDDADQEEEEQEVPKRNKSKHSKTKCGRRRRKAKGSWGRGVFYSSKNENGEQCVIRVIHCQPGHPLLLPFPQHLMVRSEHCRKSKIDSLHARQPAKQCGKNIIDDEDAAVVFRNEESGYDADDEEGDDH
ncbi:unnamed protein product [Amoebophrya sp. A120]|nr:unnamed protein product [Amoebophrya sp. A120]|eukprot:GSA120T00016620001.1